MESDVSGTFPAYRSFEEIPIYIPPQPTPLASSVDIPMPSQIQTPGAIIRHIGTEFTPEPEVGSGFGLQVDLDRDSRAMQTALEPVQPAPEPTAVSETVAVDRSIDFKPTNGIQTLREEFGAEYDVLSG